MKMNRALAGLLCIAIGESMILIVYHFFVSIGFGRKGKRLLFIAEDFILLELIFCMILLLAFC